MSNNNNNDNQDDVYVTSPTVSTHQLPSPPLTGAAVSSPLKTNANTAPQFRPASNLLTDVVGDFSSSRPLDFAPQENNNQTRRRAPTTSLQKRAAALGVQFISEAESHPQQKISSSNPIDQTAFRGSPSPGTPGMHRPGVSNNSFDLGPAAHRQSSGFVTGAPGANYNNPNARNNNHASALLPPASEDHSNTNNNNQQQHAGGVTPPRFNNNNNHTTSSSSTSHQQHIRRHSLGSSHNADQGRNNTISNPSDQDNTNNNNAGISGGNFTPRQHGLSGVTPGSAGAGIHVANAGESGAHLFSPGVLHLDARSGASGAAAGGGGGSVGRNQYVEDELFSNSLSNHNNTEERGKVRNSKNVLSSLTNDGNILIDGDDDNNKDENNIEFGKSSKESGFRPSLRLVIAIACGLVILIVAVVTLVVTNTISTETVRDLGLSLSKSYVVSATNKASDYFTRPYDDLRAFSLLWRKEGITEIADNPNMKVSEICDGARMLVESANNTYPTIGLLGESGSVFGILPYVHLGMVGCGLRNNWNATASGVSHNDLEFYYMSNSTRVPDNSIPENSLMRTTVDSRGSTYYSMKSVAQNKPGVVFALTAQAYLDGSGRLSLNVPFFAAVINASGDFIGISALSIPSDRLNSFFNDIERTENGEILAIDRSYQVIGSTYPEPISVTYSQSPSLTIPAGCTSSTAVVSAPIAGIVCPYTLETYKFRPANLLFAQNDNSFLAPPTGTTKFQEMDVDDEPYFMVSSSVPNPAALFALFIIFVMPTSDILSAIESGRNLTIAITAVIFLVAIIAAFILVFRLLRPLNQILYLMDMATKLELDTTFTDLQTSASGTTTTNGRHHANLSNIWEIYELQLAYRNMASAIDAFTKYVPKEIVRDIAESGTLCKIGMRQGYASTCFLDIAGYSSISIRCSNLDLSIALTIFYEQLSKCLQKTTGQLVSILGDGAFCCWNVPSVCLKHEVKAALFALMFSRETAKAPLSEAFDEMGEKLIVRIGVNSGEVSHGNCGSSQRMAYSVYGSSVNLSSRCESISKQFGTRVLLTESLALKVQNFILLRYILPIQVVGIEQTVKVYEAVGLIPDVNVDGVLPKNEENHSLQSISKAENSFSQSLSMLSLNSPTGKKGGNNNNNLSFSTTNTVVPFHVSKRKNANITARQILRELLMYEEATMKVSQLELDFVFAYNQCVDSFTEGNPSLAIQQLSEVRKAYPMFFYEDGGMALKKAIKEAGDSLKQQVVSTSQNAGGGGADRSIRLPYHPEDRCEAALITAELGAQKLEILASSLQSRMSKQQNMITTSGSQGLGTEPPVTLDDFVFKADQK